MKVKRYQINDKEYQFKSNALVPLNFYNEFNADIFQLMEEISNFIATRQKTNENLRKKAENGEKVEFVSENLNPKQQEVLVKLAFILNQNAEKFDTSYTDWLDNLDLTGFAIMQNIAVTLWVEENNTVVKSKKK